MITTFLSLLPGSHCMDPRGAGGEGVPPAGRVGDGTWAPGMTMVCNKARACGMLRQRHAFLSTRKGITIFPAWVTPSRSWLILSQEGGMGLA